MARTPPDRRYVDSPELLFDVLRLIAEGLTDAEIGVRLFIATETVKSRTGALYALMGARNRAHAVAIGYQRGILKFAGPRGVR